MPGSALAKACAKDVKVGLRRREARRQQARGLDETNPKQSPSLETEVLGQRLSAGFDRKRKTNPQNGRRRPCSANLTLYKVLRFWKGGNRRCSCGLPGRATWPPSAAVRQRSIALITFNWSRLRMAAVGLAPRGTVLAEDVRDLQYRSNHGRRRYRAASRFAPRS